MKNKNCETSSIKCKNCECFHEHTNVTYDLIKYKCCNKTLQKNFMKT